MDYVRRFLDDSQGRSRRVSLELIVIFRYCRLVRPSAPRTVTTTSPKKSYERWFTATFIMFVSRMC